VRVGATASRSNEVRENTSANAPLTLSPPNCQRPHIYRTRVGLGKVTCSRYGCSAGVQPERWVLSGAGRRFYASPGSLRMRFA
jgi:hypothetical protein